ncbi:hypothetical protein M3182_16450 [Mesobacillus maritimus]|nr:hypothetical protein [Mesobacillus maritimus]MCM3587329.1 hypothetical protein [Mesobacillus maritimus]
MGKLLMSMKTSSFKEGKSEAKPGSVFYQKSVLKKDKEYTNQMKLLSY